MTTSETSNVRAARPIGIAFGYLSLLPHPRRIVVSELIPDPRRKLLSMRCNHALRGCSLTRMRQRAPPALGTLDA